MCCDPYASGHVEKEFQCVNTSELFVRYSVQITKTHPLRIVSFFNLGKTTIDHYFHFLLFAIDITTISYSHIIKIMNKQT